MCCTLFQLPTIVSPRHDWLRSRGVLAAPSVFLKLTNRRHTHWKVPALVMTSIYRIPMLAHVNKRAKWSFLVSEVLVIPCHTGVLMPRHSARRCARMRCWTARRCTRAASGRPCARGCGWTATCCCGGCCPRRTCCRQGLCRSRAFKLFLRSYFEGSGVQGGGLLYRGVFPQADLLMQGYIVVGLCSYDGFLRPCALLPREFCGQTTDPLPLRWSLSAVNTGAPSLWLDH